MPTISMFYGVLVAIMFESGERHHLPPKQLRLVQAWVELHRDELFANWDLAANGEELFRIAPLR